MRAADSLSVGDFMYDTLGRPCVIRRKWHALQHISFDVLDVENGKPRDAPQYTHGSGFFDVPKVAHCGDFTVESVNPDGSLVLQPSWVLPAPWQPAVLEALAQASEPAWSVRVRVITIDGTKTLAWAVAPPVTAM